MTEHRHAKQPQDVENWINTQRHRTTPKLLPSPTENTPTSKPPQKPLRGILKKSTQPLRGILKNANQPSPLSLDRIDYEPHRASRSKSQPPTPERAKEDSPTLRKSHKRLPSSRSEYRPPSPAPSLSSTVRPQLSTAGSFEGDYHVKPYNPNPRRESTRKAKPRATTTLTKPLYSYGYGDYPAEKCTCANHRGVSFLGRSVAAHGAAPTQGGGGGVVVPWDHAQVRSGGHGRSKKVDYPYPVSHENGEYYAALVANSGKSDHHGRGYGSQRRALQIPSGHHAKRRHGSA
ncbi:hypothetical protein RUND412_009440 [Rhizina undulata]